MTCQEHEETMRKSPFDCPPSLRLAMIKHQKECKECWTKLKADNARIVQKLHPAVILLAAIGARLLTQEMREAARRDPEVMP